MPYNVVDITVVLAVGATFRDCLSVSVVQCKNCRIGDGGIVAKLCGSCTNQNIYSLTSSFDEYHIVIAFS